MFISCVRTRNEPKKAAYGSDASAAGGRESEQSEWLRSIADEGYSMPRKISGTATGRRCTWPSPRPPPGPHREALCGRDKGGECASLEVLSGDAAVDYWNSITAIASTRAGRGT